MLQAAKLRYDDTYRANLGDLVFVPFDRIDLPLFGTKTDQKRLGQQSPIPFSTEAGSAWVELTTLLNRGALRLATLPIDVRDRLIDQFVSAVGNEPLPATISAFPAGCLDPLFGLCSSVSGEPLPIHRLPLFGDWLSKNHLGTTGRLAGRASYKPLLRRVKLTAARIGIDPNTVGTHSLRRGGAFEMDASNAPPDLIMQALRHTTAASTQRYLSPSIKAARIAALHSQYPPDPVSFPSQNPPDLNPAHPPRRGQGRRPGYAVGQYGIAPRRRGGSSARAGDPPSPSCGPTQHVPARPSKVVSSPLHQPSP